MLPPGIGFGVQRMGRTVSAVNQEVFRRLLWAVGTQGCIVGRCTGAVVQNVKGGSGIGAEALGAGGLQVATVWM